jgi:hypothetical protein
MSAAEHIGFDQCRAIAFKKQARELGPRITDDCLRRDPLQQLRR